jgi:hypothetical protein
MNSFDAYVMYIALKRHFSSSYDYVKYNGKVNVSVASLEKRRDKYSFHKLAKQPDPFGLAVANLFEDTSKWVGDLFDDEAQRVYTAMKKRRETLSYTFKDQLLSIDNFKDSFTVVDGQHPPLLKAYLRGKIGPETLIILNSLGGFFDSWDAKITETYQWPEVKFKLNKLAQFFDFDRAKFKKIFKSVMDEMSE